MRTLSRVVVVMLAVTVAVILSVVAHPGASAQGMRVASETCPKQLHLRSPEQVLRKV